MMIIRVGGKEIGQEKPCLLAAEVGINHNGDLELAKKHVIAAVEAGADAVKFQNYRTEDFLQSKTLRYTYRSQGREITESQWEMFKRCEPSRDWWPQLKSLCDELGVLFFSTPTAKEGVDELVHIGTALLKNGSDYLTHTPLIEYMAATGIPVVASTGMANQQEIDDAVNAVNRGGKSPLILLHCTSSYPTPQAHANLRRMVALGERYEVLVGFSDHTEGYQAACQAVTLGACMIEKHFTLDHDLPGPDHWFSSTPQEFALLVKEVRAAEARLGAATILPDILEEHARREYRVGIVASQDIQQGAKLSRHMVAFRRPGSGLLPTDLSHYLNWTVVRNISAGEPLMPEDLASTCKS